MTDSEHLNTYEMSNEGFEELAREIMSLGFDEQTAYHYAARIGDTPIIDPDGKIVVIDEYGKVLARLALNLFSEKPKEPEPAPTSIPDTCTVELFERVRNALLRLGHSEKNAKKWTNLIFVIPGRIEGEEIVVLDWERKELGRVPAIVLLPLPEVDDEFLIEGQQ